MGSAPATGRAPNAATAALGPLRSATCLHALPGRLRLRIDDLKGCPDLSRSIEQELGYVAGVRRVEANPVTGSVLIVHDETVLDRRDVLAALLAWDVVVDGPPGPVGGAASASASPRPAPGVGRRLVGAVVRSGVEVAIQSAVQSAVRSAIRTLLV